MMRRNVIAALIVASTCFAFSFDFRVSGPSSGAFQVVNLGDFKNALHNIEAIDRSFQSAFSGNFRIARMESEFLGDRFDSRFRFSGNDLTPLTTPAAFRLDPRSGLVTHAAVELPALYGGGNPTKINLYYTQALLPNLRLTYGAGIGYLPMQAGNPNVVDQPRSGMLLDSAIMYQQALGGVGSLGLDFSLSKHISFVFTGTGCLTGLTPVRGEYLTIGAANGQSLSLSGMDFTLSYYDALLAGVAATSFDASQKARKSAFSISAYTVTGGVRFTF